MPRTKGPRRCLPEKKEEDLNYYTQAGDLLEQIGFDRTPADQPVTLHKARTGKTLHYWERCGRLTNSNDIQDVTTAPAAISLTLCDKCQDSDKGREATELWTATVAMRNMLERIEAADEAWAYSRVNLLKQEQERCETFLREPRYQLWSDDLLRISAQIGEKLTSAKTACENLRPMVMSCTAHRFMFFTESEPPQASALGDVNRYSGPGRRTLRAAQDAFRTALTANGDIDTAKKAAFDTIVASEDTDRHKPDPEPFLEAARRLSARPERCVVWEDSDLGIEAARRAGMEWIDVRSFHRPERLT